MAELRAEHRYVDACKISKGLEPKFGNFVTKAAVVPEVVPEPIPQVIETKTKKENKKEKKQESAAGQVNELLSFLFACFFWHVLEYFGLLGCCLPAVGKYIA